jgi:gamma-glutamylcyclotransferase (GGCT)/AIG2-like uncharacterized protein YtfP
MNEMPAYLFVYGTLLNKQNEFGAYLNRNCVFYANGKFRGRLYDIGEYPGAILASKGSDYVFGSILTVNDIDEVLQKLDDYEGFGYGQQQPYLFNRAFITIETNDKPVKCWVYLYNWPVQGFAMIPSGNYLQYMEDKGRGNPS